MCSRLALTGSIGISPCCTIWQASAVWQPSIMRLIACLRDADARLHHCWCITGVHCWCDGRSDWRVETVIQRKCLPGTCPRCEVISSTTD